MPSSSRTRPKTGGRKPVTAREKSVDKSVPAHLFQPGHDPRRGRGPEKGAPNAGRPPNEHIEFCRRLISDPSCEAAALAVLTNQKHPAFAAMWKAVADRAYGKAKQNVEMTGKDGRPIQHEHSTKQTWTVGDRKIAWN